MGLKSAILFSGREFAFWEHLGFAYRFLIEVTVKPPNCLREE